MWHDDWRIHADLFLCPNCGGEKVTWTLTVVVRYPERVHEVDEAIWCADCGNERRR